jgi:exosortase
MSQSSRLPLLGLLPSAVALVWLVSRARWFWNHNPELQIGWIVLLLSGYLLFEAWEKRPPPRFRWSGTGAALVLLGLATLFFAQLYQAAFGVTTEGMSLLGAGVMLFVAGNVHYVFGRAGIACFAFGCAFLLLALPVPDTIYFPLVSGLQSKVAAANVTLLNLIGIPAEQTGSAIRLPRCVVGIDEACSGVRSLQSATMATLFIGYLTLRKKSLQAALLALGILAAIVGNLVRSFFLSYTANAKGAAAIQSYHDAAGWSILAFTALAVAVFAWLLNKLEKYLARPQA